MGEIIWVTGQKGSGKTTFARKLLGQGVVWLDGDAVRDVFDDGDYSRQGRFRQGIRVAKLAKLIANQGFSVVVSVIAPYEELRAQIRKMTNCTFYYLTHNPYPDDPEYPYEPAWDAEVIIDRREDVEKWNSTTSQS